MFPYIMSCQHIVLYIALPFKCLQKARYVARSHEYCLCRDNIHVLEASQSRNRTSSHALQDSRDLHSRLSGSSHWLYNAGQLAHRKGRQRPKNSHWLQLQQVQVLLMSQDYQNLILHPLVFLLRQSHQTWKRWELTSAHHTIDNLYQ